MLSRTLIIVGVILVITGLVIGFAPKIPFLGRLPGDLYFRKDNVSFYFPLTTSIIISVILSLLFYLFGKH